MRPQAIARTIDHRPTAQMRARMTGVGFGLLVSAAVILSAVQGHAQAVATGADTSEATAQPGATITAAGIATLGDPTYPDDFAHLAYVNPEAPKGGELSEWTTGAFDTYNPFTVRGRPVALATIPLESMMEGTADTVGESYCLLCESLEYPESKDWVIFTLREGITFSDGTPMTAEDVLFSYEQLRDKGLSSFRQVITQIVADAEVLDDRRIRYSFKDGYPRRDIIQTVGGLPVFSKAQFEAESIDLEQSLNFAFIGSGPYEFGSARDGRTVTWVRNEDYWGKDLALNVGRHNFDTLRIEYFGDYNSAFEGFKAGAYTFRNEASSINWATGYNFPAFQKGDVVRQELHNGDVASGQAFVINLRRERFQDPKVREALGLMFNFEWSNETLFYGLYERVQSVWENSDLEATGAPSEDELAILEPLRADLPEATFADPPVQAPVSGERQLDRRNMRAAAALLDEAGWEVGNDGMRRNADGQTLRVEIIDDSQSFDRVINPYIENLRAIGVDAVYSRIDDAELETRRRGFDFDMLTTQLGQGLLPGSNLQQYFGSASTDDVFNLMGLANPAVDKLIRLVEEAETQEELTTRVHALDRALRAFRFWVPQWYKGTHTVAYYDMYEHPEQLPPFALGEMDFWWYNAEKGDALRASGAL